MRVLHIHDHDLRWPLPAGVAAPPLRGGLDAYLAALLPLQAAHGCTPAVVRFTEMPSLAAERPGAYYELRRAGLRYRPEVVEGLKRVLDELKPDVVHLHAVHYALAPRMLEWLLGRAAVVYTLHDVTPICLRQTKLHRDGTCCTKAVGLGCITSGCHRVHERGGWLRGAVDVLNNRQQLALYRRLPVLIVPSRYLQEQMQINGCDAGRVHVVPHFTRYPDAPEPEAVGGRTPRLLFVGRLTAEKGVEVLAQALVQIRLLEWELVIVGEGPLEATLRARLDAAGLGRRARFVGVLGGAALGAAYAGCDVVVMPSLQPESFGLVGVEAASFGRPVVGFVAGGMSEWLLPEQTGLAAAHGDAGALAEQLTRLLEDAELRLRLGMSGRALVRERFGPRRHLCALLELYGGQSAAVLRRAC